MTNGEKLCEVFPNNRFVRLARTVQFCINPMSLNQQLIVVDRDFWDAEYQEPTTKNDLVVDAVSRDVVRKYIQDHIHEIITESGEDKNKHTNRILRSMIHGVNCMPSVTPRKRKGHWVYIPQQRLVDEIDDGCVYETDYRCFCSECGGDFGFIKNEDEFCKFCGADMREVEE